MCAEGAAYPLTFYQHPASIYVLAGPPPDKCAEPTQTIHEHAKIDTRLLCPPTSRKKSPPPPAFMRPIRPIMSYTSHMSYRSHKSYRSYNNELPVRDKGEAILLLLLWLVQVYRGRRKVRVGVEGKRLGHEFDPDGQRRCSARFLGAEVGLLVVPNPDGAKKVG